MPTRNAAATRGRAKFTKEDDELLMQHVMECARQGKPIAGVKIFRDLANDVGFMPPSRRFLLTWSSSRIIQSNHGGLVGLRYLNRDLRRDLPKRNPERNPKRNSKRNSKKSPKRRQKQY